MRDALKAVIATVATIGMLLVINGISGLGSATGAPCTGSSCQWITGHASWASSVSLTHNVTLNASTALTISGSTTVVTGTAFNLSTLSRAHGFMLDNSSLTVSNGAVVTDMFAVVTNTMSHSTGHVYVDSASVPGLWSEDLNLEAEFAGKCSASNPSSFLTINNSISVQWSGKILRNGSLALNDTPYAIAGCDFGTNSINVTYNNTAFRAVLPKPPIDGDYEIIMLNATSFIISENASAPENVPLTIPTTSGAKYNFKVFALTSHGLGAIVHQTNFTATGSTFSFLYNATTYGTDPAFMLNQTAPAPNNGGLGVLVNTSYGGLDLWVWIIIVIAIVAVAAITLWVYSQKNGRHKRRH